MEGRWTAVVPFMLLSRAISVGQGRSWREWVPDQARSCPKINGCKQIHLWDMRWQGHRTRNIMTLESSVSLLDYGTPSFFRKMKKNPKPWKKEDGGQAVVCTCKSERMTSCHCLFGEYLGWDCYPFYISLPFLLSALTFHWRRGCISWSLPLDCTLIYDKNSFWRTGFKKIFLLLVWFQDHLTCCCSHPQIPIYLLLISLPKGTF
jgi:hypothetical protein